MRSRPAFSDFLPLLGDERITGDAEVGIFNTPLGGPNPLAPIIAKSSEIGERFLSYARGMTIRRIDNVGVIPFVVELDLELEGEGAVEGRWANRVVGLNGVRVDVAMMRTPDGHGRLELTKFHRLGTALKKTAIDINSDTRSVISTDTLFTTFDFRVAQSPEATSDDRLSDYLTDALYRHPQEDRTNR
jgi:hypothetical protein